MLFSVLRPVLFLLPPETAHHVTLVALKLLHACGLSRVLAGTPVNDPATVFGLQFANRAGLAAGLDKNGDYIDALGALGFGFVEVGTITPLPQLGNPLPRLFRIPEREAIINRMGFNNKGVDHLVAQLQQRTYRGVVGVNIGKNATTPVENALDDYLICLNKVHAHASYITINLSSPNTPGLRSLQYGAALDNLLQGLRTRCSELDNASKRKVPLLLKIAPDLEAEDIASIASSVLACGIDGVIATNTTLDRTQVAGCQHAEEAGGLSGAPVREKSTVVLRELCAQLQKTHLQNKLPVIGVGGILQASDAGEKIQAGAELVQIYSGLIYRGPGLVNAVATFLRELTHKAKV